MTRLECSLRLPKPGTYINLLLEHSRKCTTTILGGSCRVDTAFIQLLFTDTHQGQNWSWHCSESRVPYLWKHGARRILCKLLTASSASEHLCCSVPMTIFITFWASWRGIQTKRQFIVLSFRHIHSTGEGMTARQTVMWSHNYWASVRDTCEDKRRDLAYFTLSAIHFWIIFFAF